MKDKIYIIGEAGVNHNGDISLAKKLIDEAVNSKVDAVKFQVFIPELGISRHTAMAEYQKSNLGLSKSQLEMVKEFELSFDQHVELYEYCKQKNITYLSSPFDIPSVEFLSTIVPFFKIPSGEIINLPYLRKIASYGKDVVLSTGMSTLNEISEALEILTNNGLRKSQITILHCTSNYPCAFENVNLRSMLNIKEQFGVKVGYSDHTLGIDISIAAAALGASVIEKHFTLDKKLIGPDHKASLEPNELKEMVSSIRIIETALGNYEKKPTNSEQNNITVGRKSIVARRHIKSGEIFSEENIICKRPGNGLSPMLWDSVIGKKAKKDFDADEFIYDQIPD